MRAATEASESDPHSGLRIGRYLLHRQIARGGMATIHLARLMGDEGFSRIVAAKRLQPEFAEDADFVTMFLDEARVASKIHHKNVVPVLDVVMNNGEVVLVQEYVHGAPLNQLLKLARQNKEIVPINIAVALIANILSGLQAAHDTTDEIGMPLNIVHRDVSPQNIMVATDGTARLLDFGVAKATMAAHVTRENAFKGKLAYSAPEQLNGSANRQSDIYSAAVVLWEIIVGHRMHDKASENEIVAKIMTGNLPSLKDALGAEKDLIAKERWAEIEAIAPVIEKGLALELHARYATATAMEADLVQAVKPAPPLVVIAWLKSLGKEILERNDKLLAAEEASWRRTAAPARLTPFPAERRSRPLNIPPEVEITNVTQMEQEATAAAQYRRRLRLYLGAAVLLLGGVLVFAFGFGRDKTEHAAARPETVESAPPATSTEPPPVAPAPAETHEAARPTAAPTETPAPAEPPKEAVAVPVVSPTETETKPAAKEPAPARKRTSPQPVKKVAKQVTKTQPKTTPPPVETKPPPPVETKPDAKADCNPPYYFQGSKKIFKPQCL